MVIPSDNVASGRIRSDANQASVSRGVVAVSSTPHTHSINSSSPLANQVYTPWMTLSHAQPTISPAAAPNRSKGFGKGNISATRPSPLPVPNPTPH